MQAWGPLSIKKLDVAKLWAYFTLKLSWPIINARTNGEKLKKVSIHT